ncbi:hypothetical protein EVJ58_g8824 [Rhodofomes roseus]|uniref:Ssl1-like domain-containing protein n=1 Tax=Rhodofomes roseus TaxID=34475 RepID=A0A4Y9XYJ3_9APHY|nr:hypothetical protein EVJ58_g8824 [Rhodofomes roseus]
MPPRRLEPGYHDGESDSDVDIFDDFGASAKSKGKGKGKAIDRGKKEKGKGTSKEYAREFVTEWFDQNPLGQIGVVGMRAGIGERLGEMTGNPQEVLKAISERHKLEPTGEPSLQNAIDMARSSTSHLPTHSSREILIIFGSLTTCDPGNIHETLAECVKDRIRISVVALAAEMKICRELCDKTGGGCAHVYSRRSHR